jgi:nucleoside-diphosphate-sugar epimerase
MTRRFLITGGTGFIGGHLCESLSQQENQVVALVRPASDTSFLDSLPITVVKGEWTDAALLRNLVADTDILIHCAAKVGDWGPLDDYRRINVEGLRSLLDACKGQALSRFVLMSSLGVYATRHHHGTTEDAPLPSRHPDSYSQTKAEAEQLARHYHREFGIPVVILRPGFVYGPRDRTVMPKLIEGLRQRIIRYPGGGHGALNTIYIGNLLQAVFLAVDREEAVGQTYNLTDGEFVSKRRFLEAVADAMKLPHPRLTPPLWLAALVTRVSERIAKLTGAKKAPFFTSAKLKFLGYNLDFSIDKAKMELGYYPRFPFDDAMFLTMEWYRENYGSPQPVNG